MTDTPLDLAALEAARRRYPGIMQTVVVDLITAYLSALPDGADAEPQAMEDVRRHPNHYNEVARQCCECGARELDEGDPLSLIEEAGHTIRAMATTIERLQQERDQAHAATRDMGALIFRYDLTQHKREERCGEVMSEECKHLKSQVRPSSLFGIAYCPDCKEAIPIHIVFNNFLDAMREALDDTTS